MVKKQQLNIGIIKTDTKVLAWSTVAVLGKLKLPVTVWNVMQVVALRDISA